MNVQVRDKSHKNKKEIVVRIMKAAFVCPTSAATPLGYTCWRMHEWGFFTVCICRNTQNLWVAPSTGRFDPDQSAELVKRLDMRLLR
jgi:hypothetical protein